MMKQIIKNNSIGIQANNINFNIHSPSLNQTESDLKSDLSEILPKDNAAHFDFKSQAENNEIPHTILDIPGLPERTSKRKLLIEKLLQYLKTYNWLSIQGDKASGKSCLALLLEKHFKGRNKWVSFRDINGEKVDDHFNKVCFLLFREQIPSQGVDNFFNNCMSKYPKNSIFIFDDLPDLSQNCTLMQKLISFSKASRQNEIKIISTGFCILPENFKNVIGPSNLKVFDNTPFGQEEVIELLEIFNAPPVEMKFINLILAITKGNPVLIQAVTSYLESKSCNFDLGLIDEIVKKKFAVNELKEFLTIFSRTVDEDTRELIYRLDLILHDFTDSEIKLVSEVTPQIKNSFEKFNTITNIWVRNVGEKFSISPLIKDIGKKNLPEETIEKVNASLAKDRLKKGELNQYDSVDIISYFFGAKEYDLAASIFLQAINSLIDVCDQNIDDAGLSIMWSNLRLPKEITLNLRLGIRASQLRLFEKTGQDNSFILKDLEALLNHVTDKEKLSVLWVVSSLALVHIQTNLNTFCGYLIKALNIGDIHAGLPVDLDMGNNLNIEFVHEFIFNSMFLAQRHIKTHKDIFEWLKIIEKIPPESTKYLLESKRFVDGFNLLCNRVWRQELDKPKRNQNWEEILNILREIGKKALVLNLEVLWCSSVREQVTVLGEHIGASEKAIQVGNQALQKVSKENKIGQYLIKDIIAYQYLNEKEFKKADEWFREANVDKLEIESLHVLRLYSYLFHSVAVSNFDKDRALTICQKALNFAEKYRKSVSTNLLIITLGELAIQKFYKLGLEATFEVFERGIETLLNSDTKDNSWINLAYSFGHLGGYFSSSALRGAPINKTISGEEYKAPMPGRIISGSDAGGATYDPVKDSFVFSQMVSMYAEGIENDDKALRWGLLSYNHFKETGSTNYIFFFHTLAGVVIPNLIINRKFDEAVRLSKEILLANPIPEEKIIELAIYQTIIPIFFELGCSKNSDLTKSENLKDTLDRFQNFSWEPKKVNLDLWGSVVKICRVIFLDEKDDGNIFNGNFSKDERVILAKLTYLGNSIKINALPEHALQIHWKFLKDVNDFYFKSFPYLSRKIVFPFFKDYWEKKFNDFRFRFRSPKRFEEELKKAFDSSSKDVLENIFSTIARGLGISLGKG